MNETNQFLVFDFVFPDWASKNCSALKYVIFVLFRTVDPWIVRLSSCEIFGLELQWTEKEKERNIIPSPSIQKIDFDFLCDSTKPQEKKQVKKKKHKNSIPINIDCDNRTEVNKGEKKREIEREEKGKKKPTTMLSTRKLRHSSVLLYIDFQW